MKHYVDPLAELRQARDTLALEAFSLSAACATLKGALPSIIRGFTASVQETELPPIALNKDQAKFVKEITSMPYASAMQLKAFRPEGVKVTYLQYLAVLQPTTHLLKDLQSNVVQPYLQFLAQVISDKNAALATQDQASVYQGLERTRDTVLGRFAALYNSNSHDTACTVKDVVERHADWSNVFAKLDDSIASLKRVNLQTLKLQLAQSTDYLKIIYDLFQKGQLQATSPETARRLSNGAYQVAKEMEFFSTTYYRALALNGSVDNTRASILSVLG